jgi:D-alanyl-D-alanine dipeptidase
MPLTVRGVCLVLFIPFCSSAQPVDTGRSLAPDLVELVRLDTTIHLDIRYATENNFMHRRMYAEARAFLQRPAALALARANAALRRQGYGLVVFDGYRPWAVTKAFWDATPRAHRKFVANPNKGSKHNRGCAADVSLYALADGKEVGMPSRYDEFSPRAAADYPGGSAESRRLRSLLRRAMEREGFSVDRNEWWHFDYREWRSYGILNIPFDSVTHSP